MTSTLLLPPETASVPEGRRFVSALLESWGLHQLAGTAALLTSELLTNSVLHARTPITLTVRRNPDGIEIVVRDGSQFGPRQRQHAQDATTGRGIELLGALARSWAVDVDQNGKSISFTLRVGDDPWSAYTDLNWPDPGPR